MYTRLADSRERVAELLDFLATDDLEPVERNWFELEVAEQLAEIDNLQSGLVELARLVYEIDGLTTPTADSSIGKQARAKALRYARAARTFYRAGVPRDHENEARRLALKVRDAISEADPVGVEMEMLGRLMLAMLDAQAEARLALSLEKQWVPHGVAIDVHTARVARAGFRAGIRAYSPRQTAALDELVARKVVVLSTQRAEEHHNEMVRLTHRGLLPPRPPR